MDKLQKSRLATYPFCEGRLHRRSAPLAKGVRLDTTATNLLPRLRL
jgi:hypothetical protein